MEINSKEVSDMGANNALKVRIIWTVETRINSEKLLGVHWELCNQDT
jgi:hypothetical protein